MYPNWDHDVTPRRETDGELRERLLYVAGDGHAMRQRIEVASGAVLDLIADEYGLRRRQK